jgi:hypothetical protein
LGKESSAIELDRLNAIEDEDPGQKPREIEPRRERHLQKPGPHIIEFKANRGHQQSRRQHIKGLATLQIKKKIL